MGTAPGKRQSACGGKLSTSPGASVIVVNFNGAGTIQRCIESLRSQDVAFERVVVDNGSTDGSLEWLRGQPEVRLVEAPGNLGFAGGCNLGMRAARGKHLVLLNNDAFARPGWLKSLIAAADSELAAGAITSKIVYADRPGIIQSVGTLLLGDGSGGDRGSGEVDRGQYARREEVFGFCGAAALLRRDALADAGQFDERFFMYYEDTDLSWRLRLRGWSVVYEPAAVVDHVHAGSAHEWSPLFTFHVDRNRLFMLVKNARTGLLLRSFASLAWRAVKAPRQTGPNRPPTDKAAVLRSLMGHLPGLLWTRIQIRSRRRTRDADIERWLVARSQWDARSA